MRPSENNERIIEGGFSGYLTVFLSLCLPVILSLFFTLIEGARMNAIRMQIEVVADTAMDSVMAEYHRELLRQYDLLMIDTSYGTDNAGNSQLEEHLRGYMTKNFSASGMIIFGKRDFTGISLDSLAVTGTRYAADNHYQALREQIYAYMYAEPIAQAVADANNLIEEYTGLNLDLNKWEKELRDKKERMSTLLKNKKKSDREQHSEKESGEESDEEKEAAEKKKEAEEFARENGVSEEQLEDPASEIDIDDQSFLLGLVLGDGEKELSHAKADTSDLLSHRSLHEGDGAKADNSHAYPEADTIVLDFYAFEKCGNYRNPLEKSELKYQLEYLLNGEPSDKDNLEKTVGMLLLTRLAVNAGFLMTDSAKREEINTWASMVAALFGIPLLHTIVYAILVIAWSYTEALQDVKTLMAGGKVPLLKTGDNWKTRLANIFAPGHTTKGETGGKGLNYEAYLHLFLFLKDPDTKSGRLMDVMEMDIRRTPGNEHFRMDWCVDTFSMEAETTSSFGWQFPVVREMTYN